MSRSTLDDGTILSPYVSAYGERKAKSRFSPGRAGQIRSRSTSRLIGWSRRDMVLGWTGDIQESSPSDTHLLGKHTQEHVLRGGELVLMLGFLKHEAGVRLQAHRERFSAFGGGLCEGHGPSRP